MDRPITISTNLSTLSAIGAAIIAVLTIAGFLLTTTVSSLNRQSDIISTSVRTELNSFKLELQKLGTNVVVVDEKVNKVDTSVAVADFQTDQVEEDVVEVKKDVGIVKDDVVEVKEDVIEVKDDVVEVKEEVVEVINKVDEIGSDLNDTAGKLDIIKSALVVGFKDNEAVRLLLEDDRLSLLLPQTIFSNEPMQGAAYEGNSQNSDLEVAENDTRTTIAKFCQTQSEPLEKCYAAYLEKAEKRLLIGSIEE